MLNFQDVYADYAAEVYRFAFWLAGESAEAEDITSETFVRAWVKRSAIRTETLKAYLFTIARNTFLERRRKAKRRVALDDLPTRRPARRKGRRRGSNCRGSWRSCRPCRRPTARLLSCASSTICPVRKLRAS